MIKKIVLLTFTITFLGACGLHAEESAQVENLPISNSAVQQKGSQDANQSDTALPKYEFAKRIHGLDGLHRFGKVSDSVYRGAHPEPEGYRTLHELGIKTIVELDRSKTRASILKEYGFDYIHIPMDPTIAPSETQQRKFLKVLTDTEAMPIFVHCYHGKDRAGVMMALYRIKVQNWPIKRAIEEMEKFGHDPEDYPNNLEFLNSLE